MEKLILLSIAAAIAIAAIFAFIVFSASGNGDMQQPFDGMMSGIMMEGNTMQMPVSKDVIMMLESRYELPRCKAVCSFNKNP